MNIVAGVMGIVIIITGAWYIYTRDHLIERSQRTTLSVDISACSAQQNGAYVCPNSSVAPFGDVAVMDTATKDVCVVSFNGTHFTFTGKKEVQTPVGVIAVSLHPDGSVATLVHTGAQSISLSLDSTGRPVFAMRVGADFSREQCLSVVE
jgi:hypothetical protein